MVEEAAGELPRPGRLERVDLSPVPRSLRGTAIALVTATLVVFFAGAFPANQETQDWTIVPSEWRELRLQWEYGHAINAVLTFLALCALVFEAVLPERALAGRHGASAASRPV